MFAYKSAGQAVTKGGRHEVLHQILFRDSSGLHPHVYCGSSTAGVRARLEIVEAAGCNSTNCKMVFQCAPLFSACASTAGVVFHLSAAKQCKSVRCGIAFFCAHVHLSVQRQPLDRTTVADQFVVFIVCTRDASWFSWLVEEMARRTISEIVRITVIH